MKRMLMLTLVGLLAVCAWSQYRGGYPPRGRVVVRKAPRPPHTYSDYHWRNTYYGFRLGLNASTVRSDAPALNGNGVKAGLNLGFAVGTQLSYATPLFIESGLYYSQKGGKSNNVVTLDGPTKFTYELNYVELPIILKYKHFTYSGLSVEPYAGGYLACGVGGKVKDYGDRKAFSSYDKGHFNRFDGGLKVGLGVGYGIADADLSYDLGLANVGQDSFDDTHNGTFTINIGVNF